MKKYKTIKGWTIKASNKNQYGKHIYIPSWNVNKDLFLLIITEEGYDYKGEYIKELKDLIKKRGFKGRLKVVPCEIKFEI